MSRETDDPELRERPEAEEDLEDLALGEDYSLNPAYVPMVDDAADVVDDLEADKRAQVLAAMPEVERAAIETTLAYDDETAGRLMQREVVAAPQFWTVGQTIDHLRRESEELPELFFDVYVVDPAFKPVGAAPVSHLLRAQRDM